MTRTGSTERQGLLRDILENPDDDTPRLAYADWLQEFGPRPIDHLHGQFIAAQVRQYQVHGSQEPCGKVNCGCRGWAREARECCHGESEWLKEPDGRLPDWAHRPRVLERGFYACIQLSSHEWLSWSQHLMRRQPLTALHLYDDRPGSGMDTQVFRWLLASQWTRRLRSIRFGAGYVLLPRLRDELEKHLPGMEFVFDRGHYGVMLPPGFHVLEYDDEP